MTGCIVIFPSVGLSLGEGSRLTLFKPDGLPARAQARINHSGGILVGMGDGSVRSGGFETFDFKRSDIPLPGEAGTDAFNFAHLFSSAKPDRGRRLIGL